MLLNQLSINLNDQYVNGITHFDLASSGKWVKILVRLLDTLEYISVRVTQL